MNIYIADPPGFLFPLGIGLSILAVTLLLAVLFDLWRRDRLPTVSYGGIHLVPRRMRWIWTLGLLGALGFSVREDPIAERSLVSGDLPALQAQGPVRQMSIDLPLPFYRMERLRYSGSGDAVAEEGLEAVSIPGPLLSALLAYWILVRRWNPESRLALRLLRGRRWRTEEDQGPAS